MPLENSWLAEGALVVVSTERSRDEKLGSLERAAGQVYKRCGFRPLVLQAGMGRSGSTLLYRLLNEILIEQQRVRVKKRHTFRAWDAARAMLIFTACRDIRDAIASEIRQEKRRRELGYPARPEFLDVKYLSRRHREFYSAWRPYSSYEFVYERYRRAPDIVVAEMIDVVRSKLSVGRRSAAEIRAAAEAGRDKEMERALHRTNDGRVRVYADILSPQDIRFIESEWGDWLVEMGYLERRGAEAR